MSRITPPVPNTTLTPAYSSVSSAAGFQSGDLVYFRDSNFGTIPGNAVTSATFPVAATVNQNQIAFNTTVNWANYNPTRNTGSTNIRAQHSALLTNGNIVVVFGEHVSAGNAPGCFRIIDQNGATVVDRTVVNPGVAFQGMIGVCALTGGGFAVVLRANSTGGIFHGVYSNTGAVVTAMASDTSFGTGMETLEIQALSGGGYVIGVNQVSGTYGFRVYSSTGVGGTYSTVSGWSNSTAQIVITTFSDNSFAAVYPSASNGLSISRFNNTGTFVATYTGAGSDYYNSGAYDFITLTNGLAALLYIENSTFQIFIKSYNQSTGAVSGAASVSTTNQYMINAKALSGGGFVVTNATPGNGRMLLSRFDNSFGGLGTINIDGLPGYPRNSITMYQQRTAIIEGSTFLTLIDNTPVATNYTYGSMPYVQVDKNNFTATGIRRRFPATQTVGNISAAVSGYARSASTPNAASFLAANTQTLTVNVPQSSGTTFALTPFAGVTETVTSQCMTDMNNGQFVISYRTSVAGAARFTVFNPDGSVVTTVTVAPSVAAHLVRCTCLGNGRLVVSWVPVTNDRVNFSVYAAGTYALLATGTTTGSLSVSSPASWNGNAGHDIAPFGNDFFVLGFFDGGNIAVAVFNDSAVYQSQAATGVANCQNIRIASNATGDVQVKFFLPNAGQGYVVSFTRGPTASSIYFYSTQAFGNYNSNNWGEGFAISPYGSYWGFGNLNSSNRRLHRGLPGQAANDLTFGSMAFNAASVCIGPNGEFVAIIIDNSNVGYYRYGVSPSQGPYGSGVNFLQIDATGMTISGFNTTTDVGSQAQIVNLYDNIYAFSYIAGGGNSSGQIFVGLLCAVASSYSTTITAGVTPSNTALLPSPANGYYLAGVSASECAAGGTGIVQVNGAATLNSQYPAGTTSQAFDFNTPALDVGVRGTISGRNVILSGGK